MSNLSVNAIRFLGVDAINQSNSGHPGVVMGAAPRVTLCLLDKCMSILKFQIGLIVTVLFCQQVMVQCFFMRSFICQDLKI